VSTIAATLPETIATLEAAVDRLDQEISRREQEAGAFRHLGDRGGEEAARRQIEELSAARSRVTMQLEARQQEVATARASEQRIAEAAAAAQSAAENRELLRRIYAARALSLAHRAEMLDAERALFDLRARLDREFAELFGAPNATDARDRLAGGAARLRSRGVTVDDRIFDVEGSRDPAVLTAMATLYSELVDALDADDPRARS
jgi:hypothetical protein